MVVAKSKFARGCNLKLQWRRAGGSDPVPEGTPAYKAGPSGQLDTLRSTKRKLTTARFAAPGQRIQRIGPSCLLHSIRTFRFRCTFPLRKTSQVVGVNRYRH